MPLPSGKNRGVSRVSSKKKRSLAEIFEEMVDKNPKFFFYLMGVGYSLFFFLGLLLGLMLGRR